MRNLLRSISVSFVLVAMLALLPSQSLKAAVTVDDVVFRAFLVGLCDIDPGTPDLENLSYEELLALCSPPISGDFDRALNQVCVHAHDGSFYSVPEELNGTTTAICSANDEQSFNAFVKICEKKLSGSAGVVYGVIADSAVFCVYGGNE